MHNRASGDYRFLFVGFVADKYTLDKAFSYEESPQVSAIEFQLGILEALECNGAETTILSSLPIASYPRNKLLFVRGKRFGLKQVGVQGRLLGFVNISVVKLLCRVVTTFVYGCVHIATGRRRSGIVVYSVHTPHLIAALLLKSIFRVPVAVFINDLPIYMSAAEARGFFAILKTWETSLSRWLIARADLAFPVSVKTAEDWLPRQTRYLVIEAIAPSAGVIPKSFPKSRTLDGSVTRPRLLYAGTFSYVLKFARLFSFNPEIEAELVFVGGGADADDLKQLAALDERIQILPFMTGEAFEQQIEAADFLVNARDSEWVGGRYSFAFKLFDYMLRGRPILSTRLGSITDEYFECFLEIQDGSPDAFRRSMERALTTPEKDLCERVRVGMEIVKVRKSPEAVGKLMIDAILQRRA